MSNLGVVESFTEQHDFSDERRVGNNHGDGSEHGLQVIWKLCATSVPRVHGDEDTTRPLQLDLTTLEHEPTNDVTIVYT